MNVRRAALVLAVVLVAPSAFADREKAAAAYKQGAADFARGDFTTAAAAFDSAFAEDPRGASAYNAALSWQGAHDEPRAADDFARAIAAGDLHEDLLEAAKKALAKLETTLGRVSIAGPAGAKYSVAHASGATPAVVHLRPEHYVVHATLPSGATHDYPVDVVAGSEQHVDLAAPVVATTTTTTQPPPTQPPPPAEKVERRGVLGSATLPVGIGLVSAGVVGGGFAIGLGFATLDALDAYKKTGYTSQSAHDNATALRDWTNVALVSAVVLGAAGIAALATIHKVKVEATVGLGSLVVRGTF